MTCALKCGCASCFVMFTCYVNIFVCRCESVATVMCVQMYESVIMCILCMLCECLEYCMPLYPNIAPPPFPHTHPLTPSPHVDTRRIQELRSIEARATVQDLMHSSIVEKFQTLGIDTMPKMEGACTCGGRAAIFCFKAGKMCPESAWMHLVG